MYDRVPLVLRIRKLEFRYDRCMVRLRVLHVGGEGYRLVVEQLIVDFRAFVELEHIPRCKDVIYHRPPTLMDVREPGRLGDAAFAGYQHPLYEPLVARVLDV